LNHYSVDGGFILDALMEDNLGIETKIAKHFELDCEKLNTNDLQLKHDCDHWSISGRSIKTP
jgi:hypothetical protein